MMKKLFFFAVLAIGGGYFYSQNTGNVGINTSSPAFTLDVEGTARLATPGEYIENTKPLGIDNNTKQIVFFNNTQGDPFHAKRYTFNYTGWYGLQTHDLNISSNTHDVVLVGATLLTTQKKPPFVAISSIADNNWLGPRGAIIAIAGQGNDWKNRMTSVVLRARGLISNNRATYAVAENGENLLQGYLGGNIIIPNERGFSNSLFYSPMKHSITKLSNGNWAFQGGYLYGRPLNTGEQKWQIDVLIINKNWVRKYDRVKVRVGQDNKTLTRVSGTHPIVE